MKSIVVDILDKAVDELDKIQIEEILEQPPKPELGDYAFPCFRLAKVMRKAPNMIAADIYEKVCQDERVADTFDKVETNGAYVNFFTNKSIFAKNVIEKSKSDNYGSSDLGKGKTICIDYSSPNVAKNFHVGHLRTTVIGNSLYKIYSKLGFNVERINHLGDWGTQFGKLIVAYKNWG